LHWAAVYGEVETCAYLIEQGAEVNAPGGSRHSTPLQCAGRYGHLEAVDLLIRKGAKPRLVDADGYSCVYAVTRSSNYWALLYVLLQPDVPVNDWDKKRRSPLHWAAYQGDEESVAILLKLGADPNAVAQDGLTPLHLAAYDGNKDCIAMLLEAGADLTAKYRDETAGEMVRGRGPPTGSEVCT